MEQLKTDPALLAAIRAASTHVMTPAERYAQRRSFVIGQIWGSYPNMSREEVGAIVDKVLGEDPAALASQPTASRGDGVPAGWKLVPVEPTEEMYDAGYDATRLPDGMPQFADAGFCLGHSGNIYRAMLASAPPAPTPDAGSDLVPVATPAIGRHEILQIAECLRELVRKTWEYIDGTEYGPDECQPNPEDWLSLCAAAERLKDAIPAQERPAQIGHAVTILIDALSPPPGEDLAGQGEPVAWASGGHQPHPFQPHKEYPGCAVCGYAASERLMHPAVAAPVPSRPADRAEANRLFEAIKDALYAGDMLYGHPAHARLRELRALALRDAPRDAGDGWRPMAEAPKDGKTQIVARHKPNEHTPDGWVATITIDHDDLDEYRRGGLDTIKHYNGEALMSGFHGVWTGWMYPHEVGHGVSVPPSPNAGDGTQDTDQGGGR